MKLLSDLLYRVRIEQVAGNTNLAIVSVAFDSRKVEKFSVFVAIRGTLQDGHDYIPKALASGAIAVICEKLPEELVEGITYVKVKDAAAALSVVAANYYNHPATKLKLVGITGTNGKTTGATLLYKLYTGLGYKTGLISTVCNYILNEAVPSTHTTPDALELNRLLALMVQQGCQYCFMEVSSHAVDQRRIYGLKFAGAAFTNITHEHLDYHKTFDNYLQAKKQFFDDLPASAFAVINKDDRNGAVMVQNTKATVRYFAISSPADFKGKIIESSFNGLLMNIDNIEVWIRLIGQFNAFNIMLVYSVARMLGENKTNILTALSNLQPVEGRFQFVRSREGITAVVDYAHTPDALQNVLHAIRQVTDGKERIITVVGCGGDRDSTKRPMMAAIAASMSDMVILTSDNPRSEDPEEIIKQMQAGVDITMQRKTLAITDRHEAIKTAYMMSHQNDIILIAGKGHEKYQEIKGVKYPFDDLEEVKNLFETANK
jgi:UDP-N-acetylmuramoyl-L-alanyl-D-glutamate--2,6-diaminopimelate ligase